LSGRVRSWFPAIFILAALGISLLLPSNPFSHHLTAIGYGTGAPPPVQNHAVTPARILDTRTGAGALGPGTTRDVQITGQGGVPSTGVTAVTMNVTVTNTTAAGFLTVYPTGVARPLASSLNWTAGQTVPNLVHVAVSSNGQVTIFNSAGSTDVIFDVSGYDSTTPATGSPVDGLLNPLVPARLLDTRNGTGAPQAAVGPGQTINLQVTGQGGVPATGVSAVVLNVTAVGPSAPGFITVFPTGSSQPLASNLNFVPGQVVPNRVTVKVGTGGQVSLFNSAGNVNLVADVGGWFTDPSDSTATGSAFGGMTPNRIVDTRNGTGGFSSPVGAGGTIVVTVPGLPASATAVVLNVTVTNPTAPGFLTVWPDGVARPLASDLNFVSGQTVPNLVIVKLGAGSKVDVFNSAGATDVVIDIVGFYSS